MSISSWQTHRRETTVLPWRENVRGCGLGVVFWKWVRASEGKGKKQGNKKKERGKREGTRPPQPSNPIIAALGNDDDGAAPCSVWAARPPSSLTLRGFRASLPSFLPSFFQGLSPDQWFSNLDRWHDLKLPLVISVGERLKCQIFGHLLSKWEVYFSLSIWH